MWRILEVTGDLKVLGDLKVIGDLTITRELEVPGSSLCFWRTLRSLRFLEVSTL